MTVTHVDFSTTAVPPSPRDQTPAQFASRHVARTIAHLDKVDVGALVETALNTPDVVSMLFPSERYLTGEELLHDGEHCESCTAKYAIPPEQAALAVLILTTLFESVLDEARSTLRIRMALDVASNLLPRLSNKECT